MAENKEILAMLKKMIHDPDLKEEYRTAATGAAKLIEGSTTISREELARMPFDVPEGTININDAEWHELFGIIGTGAGACRNIVLHRERTGKRFACPYDLLAVRGMGTAKAALFVGKVQFG